MSESKSQSTGCERPATLEASKALHASAFCRAVAQWLEQGTHNPSVVGSIPTGPTNCPGTKHHRPEDQLNLIQFVMKLRRRKWDQRREYRFPNLRPRRQAKRKRQVDRWPSLRWEFLLLWQSQMHSAVSCLATTQDTGCYRLQGYRTTSTLESQLTLRFQRFACYRPPEPWPRSYRQPDKRRLHSYR